VKSSLIDSWFPYGETSVESIRERSAFTALPPLYALHVWFSRKPLTTSRASIICSLLEKQDRNKIFQILGYPTDKDIVSIQKELEVLNSKGIRKKENPFTWNRAFKHTPTESELDWLHTELKKVWGGKLPTVLDPMAGGGSIPFESIRLGLPTIASDLNPVAFVILKATLEYPAKFGAKLIPAVQEFCNEIQKRSYKELETYFPKPKGEKVFAYAWCRTIKCDKCSLLIPLSHSWWIVRKDAANGVAIKLKIPKESDGDVCSFEVVKNPKKIGYDPGEGTDIGKAAKCPRCNSTTSGEMVKKEASEGRMGHQLYCVNIKRSMGPRKQERDFRIPTKDEIQATGHAQNVLEQKLLRWTKEGIVPLEDFPSTNNDTRPLQYGMKKWIDMFNPRQLLTHLTYLEKFNEVKREWLHDKSKEKELVEAVIVYGAIVFDTCVDYNSLLSLWDSTRIKIAHTMGLQGFPFKTSYGEFDHSTMLWPWALSKTIHAISDIVKFLPIETQNVRIRCSDSSTISIPDKSIEAIIVDPPYGENVIYSEIMDFFYVWLKKMVGDLFPKEFKNELTDKDAEAVVNPALYQEAGRGQSRKLSDQHYQAKLEACFTEINRVLKNDGILTVMFTHRKSEAWAGLTKALLNAGFTFTSSWAVTTEPGQKFGKRDIGSLKRTVILACRKRADEKKGLWSQVKDELYHEAESKVKKYLESGITGPDLLVCTYGPVLGKFGDYSLIKDSAGNTKGPEDALQLVAEVVNKFTVNIPGADLETLAYVNLLSSFNGQTVNEDEARVTVVFGGNLSIEDLVSKGLVKKEKGKIVTLTSKQRLDAGTINLAKPDNLKTLIDVVHASLVTFEKLGIKAVKKLLEDTGKDSSDSGFIATLKAISSLGYDISEKSIISSEIRAATSLLTALGYEPESVLKKGEKLSHYPKKDSKNKKLFDSKDSTDEVQ